MLETKNDDEDSIKKVLLEEIRVNSEISLKKGEKINKLKLKKHVSENDLKNYESLEPTHIKDNFFFLSETYADTNINELNGKN